MGVSPLPTSLHLNLATRSIRQCSAMRPCIFVRLWNGEIRCASCSLSVSLATCRSHRAADCRAGFGCYG